MKGKYPSFARRYTQARASGVAGCLSKVVAARPTGWHRIDGLFG
jgi:hypothetical protein